ncbi:hypothetical protein [Pannonibacter sp. SL95]|uniref:hypothetical protein n=1 Tax=Pannonibacter sp. SL95 TaxID=2995153 RepID=UPI00227253BF|nr:hypothetical protein [Pannonibacter sp. SL95]MCY1705852.1 hypothetical protein [Pannonibacter sp. SL95]
MIRQQRRRSVCRLFAFSYDDGRVRALGEPVEGVQGPVLGNGCPSPPFAPGGIPAPGQRHDILAAVRLIEPRDEGENRARSIPVSPPG